MDRNLEIIFKVGWYPIYGPKVCLNLVPEIGLIVCYCTHEEKINFDGFTQNGCYGNQPQSFEVVGASHYAKLTGQRSVGIPEENGTTFSDKTGPTNKNGSCHFKFFFRIS